MGEVATAAKGARATRGSQEVVGTKRVTCRCHRPDSPNRPPTRMVLMALADREVKALALDVRICQRSPPVPQGQQHAVHPCLPLTPVNTARSPTDPSISGTGRELQMVL